MKRRDFIKAFGGASAALASAGTLANMRGSDKVIETFQIADIENESSATHIGIDFANGPDYNAIVDFDKAIITLQNPSYKKSILVLSYDQHQLNDFRNYNIDFIKENNIYLSRVSGVVERLLGAKRGTNIIGLRNYWKTTSDDIMEIINMRDLQIVTYRTYFNDLNTKRM